MVSSSTTSHASSSSASFTPSKFESLPIMAMREKIVEKIMENRVTLIVGETGCGKTSQVPLFLREEGLIPIICTQPRRFAVVAVAKTVAQSLQCDVGDEVGYHIGHSRVTSPRTKIVYKTAGVLLEEMRQNGLNALNYKVIILDEVHERSIESDLALVCLKQFLLRKADIRLVLMSATADISRYKDYFKDLGRGERVEVLAIPCSSQHSIFQRKVLYLEEVTKLVGSDFDSPSSLSSQYCSGPPSPLMASADIKTEVHRLMHNLVMYIHKNEPDITKSILVFLPTYYSLEQQWSLLKPFSSAFKVHILHSSIDTVQALAAMKILKSHRKVILATNIAESSVTIPEVAYVIDSCRSLQVYWDGNKKTDAAKLVWVSKSQADQRKGRTGRTCDGQVYRMVTRSFYSNLEEYEFPAILKLSLRLHVLLICSAETKSINDPKALFQKALDSPDPEVVEDALSLLVNIKAIHKTQPRGRYEPTFYGRLLSSFSLSFDASVLVVKFGTHGMLHEGILLGILMDTQPQPIVRPFGQDDLYRMYTSCYYTDDDDVTSALTGRKEVLLMSNLCAYQFWQRAFKDKFRVEHLKELLDVNNVTTNRVFLSKFEEEWCSLHNLVQPSLNQISEIYDEILSTLHLYRPRYLASYSALPSYFEPMHTCLQQYEQSIEAISFAEDHEHGNVEKCLSVPFVSSNDFQVRSVAQKFGDIVKEIRVRNLEYLSGDQQENVVPASSYVEGAPLQCRFFAKGLCNRGYDCFYSHSLQAKPPACQFFGSYRGCRNGDSCLFSHDLLSSPMLSSMANECMKEDENATQEKLVKLFPDALTEGYILLVKDDDLHFSENISAHYTASKIIVTTSVSEVAVFNPSLLGAKIMWDCHDLKQTFTPNQDKEAIPWDQVKCVLWFCDFQEFSGDDVDAQKRLVRNFFELLATVTVSNALYEMQLILTMKNVRFSQLQVEKLGRECFFFLKESFPFDERAFGEVRDGIKLKKSMVSSIAVSYVFSLHPPPEVQLESYGGAPNHALVTY